MPQAEASPADFFSYSSQNQPPASEARRQPPDAPQSSDGADDDSDESDNSDAAASSPPPARGGGAFFGTPGGQGTGGSSGVMPTFSSSTTSTFSDTPTTTSASGSSGTSSDSSSSGSSQGAGTSAKAQSKTAAHPGASVAANGNGQKKDQAKNQAKLAPAKPAPAVHFEIDQFAVEGADTLRQINVEEAVYPFLGPGRTAQDVEKARAALEKSYHDRGYQTVSVSIPQQNPQNGVIILKVAELKIGRLRVKNAHYFDSDKIKRRAASLREGTLPNFNAVTQDIVALNQWSDRRVTPALRAGVTPGTVDVDLNVDDKPPFHGSLQIDDRQSPGTSLLRVTGTAHYDDLWQLGHSLTFTYQVAPEHPADAQAFSGSYLARIPNLEWLSVLLYGVYSKSDVAAIGGLNVVGPGQIAGIRAVMTLPSRGSFYQTLSLGPDYKHFDQATGTGVTSFDTPVTYMPITASYSATFQETKALTQLDVGLTAGLRGVGSDETEFDNKRFEARSDFFLLKGDLSRQQELPQDFELYGKVQWQVADQALVSSEEFSLGGFDTVRGYLESEELGDDGVAGTIELRSPDLAPKLRTALKDTDGKPTFDALRFFGFVDGGVTTIHDALPEQQPTFVEWSTGVGTNFQIYTHLNGMVALAVPMVTQTYTVARDPRALFRVWGEF
ncbi:MAG: ShlB/FhaC/HecB family hemolysin secretion/activation protein [Pseudomonadota bacterium]